MPNRIPIHDSRSSKSAIAEVAAAPRRSCLSYRQRLRSVTLFPIVEKFDRETVDSGISSDRGVNH